jgi:hypothetical protein
MKRRILAADEYIVCAWAERCAGPGFSNSIVNLVIGKRGTPDLRRDALQPDEQSRDLIVLFPISESVSDMMVHFARAAVRNRP